MLASFPFLQKLWDRGIDITASVITSLIVAAIALLGWEFKLWLDLRADEAKLRQQHRIEEERAARKSRQDERDRHFRLKSERCSHANAVAAATKAYELQSAWGGYKTWMTTNELLSIPGNPELLRQASQHEVILERTVHTPTAAKALCDIINKTSQPTFQE